MAQWSVVYRTADHGEIQPDLGAATQVPRQGDFVIYYSSLAKGYYVGTVTKVMWDTRYHRAYVFVGDSSPMLDKV